MCKFEFFDVPESSLRAVQQALSHDFVHNLRVTSVYKHHVNTHHNQYEVSSDFQSLALNSSVCSEKSRRTTRTSPIPTTSSTA